MADMLIVGTQRKERPLKTGTVMEGFIEEDNLEQSLEQSTELRLVTFRRDSCELPKRGPSVIVFSLPYLGG